MRISNSKLKTFNRCERQYYYKYVLGLRKKARSLPLERGSWVHSLLEAYYLGKNWKKVHKCKTKEFYNLFEEEREQLGDLPNECANLMRRYLTKYPDDLDRYIVVDAEMDEIVTLPNGVEMQIIVDLIMEDKVTGKLFPWDHKTRKNFNSPTQHMQDPQLALYFKGLEILGYHNLGGVCVNEVSTKPPTVPKLLARGGLSKAKNIATDVFTYTEAIKEHGLDVADYSDILAHIAVNEEERFFRRTFMPKDPPVTQQTLREAMYAAEDMARKERTGRFIRTYIPNDCSWSCDYKDLCLTELHGGGINAMVKMNFETREQRKKREARERKKAKRG